MKKFEKIFVTVGTTEFNELIYEIQKQEFVKVLQKLECKNLTVQFGNGTDFDFKNFESSTIDVQTYRTKPSISDDICNADLVISHAGVGTCLEVLNYNKPLIAVINTELMNNHQNELATQLFKQKHLFVCEPNDLQKIILTSNFDELLPYKKGDMSIFIKKLDELMGFT
ncbi:UDP-N-acetylglucosamine transferase subunit ALG13 homolog [Condylostylus longicornis]|uniref:UDP-N-acetylglucosamine transferase subunit ALG13 homolog n=1 Tax=Condylostylus longicornis TaxID=2530218 RepID=UPI00244DAE0F|nr:UDP-N-acetylglucosamine transferase subunit ALG13 homolog [Condylostylus longicornis]